MDSHCLGRSDNPDPLLFNCEDGDKDNELDNLLAAGGDSAFENLDFDPLDPSDLGKWLHNSSMSQLSTAIDTDHDVSLSEGNLLPVNPESVMPLQQTQPPQQQLQAIDSVHNAAMRLHANCSDMEELKTVNVIVQQPPSPEQRQQTQHIQIVAIPISTVNTTPHSPMKANTFILDSNSGSVFSVAGAAYISSPQKLLTVSNSNPMSQNDRTPSQCSPVLVEHLQGRVANPMRPVSVTMASPLKHSNVSQQTDQRKTLSSIHHSIKHEDKVFPKPVYSYSCLIALALKNSKAGNLPVNEIYNFMCENFPFFKTAPDGWKNSVRHNLSLNKCFAKVDNPKLSSGAKKGCLWAMNPGKVKKMEEEIIKCRKKDPANLLSSMAYPEKLEAIEKGQAGLPSRKDFDSDDDENEMVPAPSTPVKKDLTSTPQKQFADMMVDDYAMSPVKSTDLEQEYVAHALQWGLEDADIEDLLTITSLPASPLAAHGSLSRSVPKLSMTPTYPGSLFTTSPARLLASSSPSSARTNLFGVATPRTLSALN